MPTKKVKKICIPKNETQQSQFLSKYPEFDGRGLKMAIIDGGIDVSLPGLQKTSTGLPKIIDCFDFTGNGNIDTSTIKKVDENNFLIALSGRELKIPLNWKNPSGEWHLGVKSLLKLFQICHRDKDYERKLNYLIPKAAIDSVTNENLKLENHQKDLNNCKDIIDCIIWNDGERWLASLITSVDSNNLENAKVLTNFRDEYDFCFIKDKFVCCITIRNDGNQLQICTSSYPHGTTVAQVAVSHYPDGSANMDGLAPGAQIYFMEVLSGDYKNGFVEKALLIDVLSIISVTLICRDVIDKLTEMQNQHGTIIVIGAGNDGPLFWSTAMEEELDDAFFFIGSLITPEMNERIHKWKSPNLRSTKLSSSKGPSNNNHARRISFVAPGQVIVPTTSWISKQPQFANGTSMAAPNAADSIACLLSALKVTSIPYSPALVKFALENTAIPLEDKLAAGAGIIQIDSAFEFLKNFSKINIQISFPQIFIKDTKLKGIAGFVTPNIQSQKYCISVTTANEEENQIPWILKLSPESSNTHISHSKIVENGTFEVEIMPKSLERGKLHYAEIQGFHPSPAVIGSFFHLPITLTVPEILTSNTYQKHINTQSNKPTYLFLQPPENAKKCIFKFSRIKKSICVFQNVIEKNSKEANYVGIHKFSHEYCNLSIRWKEDIFEACFHKQEHFDQITTCKLEAKFF